MVKDYILLKSILPFLTPTYPTAVLSGPKIVTLFNVISQKNVFNFNVFNVILQKMFKLLIFNQWTPITAFSSIKAPS